MSIGKNDRQGVNVFFNRKSGVFDNLKNNHKKNRKMIKIKIKKENYDDLY